MKVSLTPPLLSVVVCTRNRLDKLRRCVSELLSTTTAHDWELIIVDNDSADGTREYLKPIHQLTHPRVKTLVERNIGLSAARNTGWKEAESDIVAFIDDDCYVSKYYVDSVVQVFGEDTTIGFLGGRILPFDESEYNIAIEESQQRHEFQPWTFIPAGSIHGANFAFRKAVLEQIRGFDEKLGAGTPFPSEDIDAVAAAMWTGVRGVYDPRVLVYHHQGLRTGKEAQKKCSTYDAGRGAYYIKYILQPKSRREYFISWARSIKDDCGNLKRGSIPKKSIRELYAAMRFALKR